jgi:IPT/TIG domain
MEHGMRVIGKSIESKKTGRFHGMFRAALCMAVVVPIALMAAGSAFAVTITSFAGTAVRAPDPPYCVGSIVTITGSGFLSGGAVTSVTFGGVPAASFYAGSDTVLLATVGAGAQTGPIVVTTPQGSATSATPELIEACASGPPTSRPAITGAPPKVKGGKKIQLHGSGFVGVTSVTVGGVTAPYAIPTDQNMYVIIPTTAKNGSVAIKLTSPAGTGTVSVLKTG